MVSKWAEHRLKIAPWRLLGEPWAALGQPSGGLGARRPIYERFWVPLGTPFGGSRMLENVLESNSNFVVHSELSFGSSGGLEPFWARFWAPRRDLQILVKNSTAPRREHDFEGSGDCQKGPKMGPKTASGGSPAPKPSWGPLEPHFGPF